MKIFTCIEVEVRVCVCACVRWPVCVLFTINRCPSCRMWAKYSNIVRFNNITFQVVGTHSDVRSLTHTHKHTHNMHTCIRSEFILLMRSDVFLLTWQLFLLPWGDWRQSYICYHGNGKAAYIVLVYFLVLSSSVGIWHHTTMSALQHRYRDIMYM